MAFRATLAAWNPCAACCWSPCQPFRFPPELESVITETVPLHYRSIGSGGEKLGIYLSIGGSGTPQIFEFDTGGAGLFAAYASNDTDESKWWGTNLSTSRL